MSIPRPKNFDSPDESIRLPGAEEDIVYVGDEMVARVVQHPGWRWSSDMRAIAGGRWCETHHVGVMLSGHQGALLRDGTVLEFGPGDVYDIPAGHDGYTVGDEPCVMIEWSGPRTWAGRSARFVDRSLMALLMTDVVDSTGVIASMGDAAWQAQMSTFVARARSELELHRGIERDLAGDGLLATFDAPARALRCASALRTVAQNLGLHVRSGVHVGEVEVAGDRVRGLAVHEAARVMSEAGADEILVSQTTRDLAEASGLAFEDRGTRALKGLPGERRLHALVGGDAGSERS